MKMKVFKCPHCQTQLVMAKKVDKKKVLGRGLGGGNALGPGGNCVCPDCGKTVVHRRGVQCFNVKCPKCGSAMTRPKK